MKAKIESIKSRKPTIEISAVKAVNHSARCSRVTKSTRETKQADKQPGKIIQSTGSEP